MTDVLAIRKDFQTGWGIKATTGPCRRAEIAGPDILIPVIYRKYDMNFNLVRF